MNPISQAMPDGESAWSDQKNQRRCLLIDKEIAGTLSSEETKELTQLQCEMLDYRRRIAPLPIEDARKLHQELHNLARSGEP